MLNGCAQVKLCLHAHYPNGVEAPYNVFNECDEGEETKTRKISLVINKLSNDYLLWELEGRNFKKYF